MLDIDKHYIFNEQGKAIAVQISIEQFQEIERLLERENDALEDRSSDDIDYPEPELIDVNGILVIKSQGGKIPAPIADSDELEARSQFQEF